MWEGELRNCWKYYKANKAYFLFFSFICKESLNTSPICDLKSALLITILLSSHTYALFSCLPLLKIRINLFYYTLRTLLWPWSHIHLNSIAFNIFRKLPLLMHSTCIANCKWQFRVNEIYRTNCPILVYIFTCICICITITSICRVGLGADRNPFAN